MTHETETICPCCGQPGGRCPSCGLDHEPAMPGRTCEACCPELEEPVTDEPQERERLVRIQRHCKVALSRNMDPKSAEHIRHAINECAALLEGRERLCAVDPFEGLDVDELRRRGTQDRGTP